MDGIMNLAKISMMYPPLRHRVILSLIKNISPLWKRVDIPKMRGGKRKGWRGAITIRRANLNFGEESPAIIGSV